MKQLIETPEDLLKFLKENWETISDNTYNAILFETLSCYHIGNRTTYEETEKLILKYVDFVLQVQQFEDWDSAYEFLDNEGEIVLCDDCHEWDYADDDAKGEGWD